MVGSFLHLRLLETMRGIPELGSDFLAGRWHDGTSAEGSTPQPLPNGFPKVGLMSGPAAQPAEMRLQAAAERLARLGE